MLKELIKFLENKPLNPWTPESMPEAGKPWILFSN
jgi:hypothetical protein